MRKHRRGEGEGEVNREAESAFGTRNRCEQERKTPRERKKSLDSLPSERGGREREREREKERERKRETEAERERRKSSQKKPAM